MLNPFRLVWSLSLAGCCFALHLPAPPALAGENEPIASEIWTWGSNGSGQLGNSAGDFRAEPQVVSIEGDLVEVAAGGYHTLALTAEGDLWAWGDNRHGQLGDGSETNRSVPASVAGDGGWVSIAAGFYESIGVRDDGSLWAWGRVVSTNEDGWEVLTFNEPQRIGGSSDWVAVTASESWMNAFGLKRDGTLWGWGRNHSRQLGSADAPTGSGGAVSAFTPVRVDAAVDWRLPSAGSEHTLALKADGSLWGWGSRMHGRFPNSLSGVARVPELLVPDMTWKEASTGRHTVAIDAAGRLWGWGLNSSGQVVAGGGTVVQLTSIDDERLWRHAAVGWEFSLAVDEDGRVWAWGAEDLGQTGGAIPAPDSGGPGQVENLHDVVSVAAGLEHAVALMQQEFSIPGNPRALVALAAEEENVVLNWRPADLHHESFLIERRKMGTDDWIAIGEAGRVPLFTDADVSHGESYRYRVRAVSPAGASGWSAEAGATAYWGAKKELIVWGENPFGQIGDGTSGARDVPTQVGDDTNWESVSARRHHVAAIRDDGTLWTWGLNDTFQLGIGTDEYVDEPRQVGDETNWKAVSAGGAHTLAIKQDGSLWAWGSNHNGQLGDGTGGALQNEVQPIPVLVDDANIWIQVSAGQTHSLGVQADGSLWAWGNGLFGRLGFSVDSFPQNRPVPQRVGDESNWDTVSAGGSHSLGLRADGSLWAWGSNGFTQLGVGKRPDELWSAEEPMQVGADFDWLAADAGGRNSIAVKTDRTVWEWGGYTYQSVPALRSLAAGTEPILGSNHTMLLDDSGEILTWGYNLYGELGRGLMGYTPEASRPTPVGTGGWKAASAGEYFSIAIAGDGSLWSWGSNEHGKLGIGDSFFRRTVADAAVSRYWGRIDAGGSHTLGIKPDGSLWAWGLNNFGQLGDGTQERRPVPVLVDAHHRWTDVSAKGTNLALTEEGELFQWGWRRYGSNDEPEFTTVPESLGHGWSRIAAGVTHRVALRDDGSLWAWSYHDEPQRVGNRSDWVAIAAGDRFSFVLNRFGTLYGWGVNNRGQLGTGTPSPSEVPQQVYSSWRWVSVAAGSEHALGVKQDGTLWTWGDERGGKLGYSVGSEGFQASPRQVGSDTDWVEVSAGAAYSMGRKRDGSIWAWGNWGLGSANVPTKLSDDLAVNFLSSGFARHFAALRTPDTIQSAPSALALTEVTPDGIRVEWESTGTDADGFVVERRTPSGEWEWAGSVSGVERGFIDTGAEPGESYMYRVFGYEGRHPSTPSPERTVVAPMTYADWMDRTPEDRRPPDGSREPADVPLAGGVPNLLKFLLGREPLEPARSSLPAAEMVRDAETGERYQAIEFARSVAAWGIELTLYVSDDLREWREVDSVLEILTDLGDGREQVRIRSAEPLQDERRGFLFLEADLPGDSQ